jgi:phosphatidylglycerol:prolipoprotein diacylglycerol transferase
MWLAIDPIAISLGSLHVRWYGIILMTGALVGLILAIREGKRFGIAPEFFTDLMFIGIPSAIIGARLYYVAFKWEDYRNNLLEIFQIWHGGIAIYGALIGAIIGGYFYTKSKGYPIWRIFDICAPGLIVGQMIGRWGNFMNQEAHGGPVEESFLRNTLHLPSWIVNQMNIEGVFYHPTFLYESVWNLLGLLFLFWLRRQSFLRSGELFLSYFIWYSIGRFFVEGVRTDSLAFTGPDWLASAMRALWSPMRILFQEGSMDYGNVRISQLLSVIIVVVALAWITYRRKQGLADTRYADPVVSSKAAASKESVTAAPEGHTGDEAQIDEMEDTLVFRTDQTKPTTGSGEGAGHDKNGTV